jgi:hypothetical protein
VAKVTIIRVRAIMEAFIFFFLNSFLVRIALNRKLVAKIERINTIAKNIPFTSIDTNCLTSSIFTPRSLKNFRSERLFELKRMNPRNNPHIIKLVSKRATKIHMILEKPIFSFFPFTQTLLVSSILK